MLFLELGLGLLRLGLLRLGLLSRGRGSLFVFFMVLRMMVDLVDLMLLMVLNLLVRMWCKLCVDDVWIFSRK